MACFSSVVPLNCKGCQNLYFIIIKEEEVLTHSWKNKIK